MPLQKINLQEKFSQVNDYWNPRIAGELNGQQVKLAMFHGEFPWHHHENEDEMFLVISGSFIMELRDQTIQLDQGEFIIIPKGTEHRPVAKKEAHVLLFEPASTLNTGNEINEMTREELEWI